jgi:hypothetical protein
MSNFMKIRPVGAELFHVERQTDGEREGWTDGRTSRHNEVSSHFSQFANAPENVGRIQLRRPDLVGKIMLKLISRTLWLCGRDSKLSQEGFEWQGFCEHDTDTSGFVKGRDVPLAKEVCGSTGRILLLVTYPT